MSLKPCASTASPSRLSNTFQRYLQASGGDVGAASANIANDLLESLVPEQRAAVTPEEWNQTLQAFAQRLKQEQLGQMTQYPTDYSQQPTVGQDFLRAQAERTAQSQQQANQSVLNYPTDYSQQPIAGQDFLDLNEQRINQQVRELQQQLDAQSPEFTPMGRMNAYEKAKLSAKKEKTLSDKGKAKALQKAKSKNVQSPAGDRSGRQISGLGSNGYISPGLFARTVGPVVENLSYVAKTLKAQIGGMTDIPIREYRDWETDRKSTRLNSSHLKLSRMPSSA